MPDIGSTSNMMINENSKKSRTKEIKNPSLIYVFRNCSDDKSRDRFFYFDEITIARRCSKSITVIGWTNMNETSTRPRNLTIADFHS